MNCIDELEMEQDACIFRGETSLSLSLLFVFSFIFPTNSRLFLQLLSLPHVCIAKALLFQLLLHFQQKDSETTQLLFKVAQCYLFPFKQVVS